MQGLRKDLLVGGFCSRRDCFLEVKAPLRHLSANDSRAVFVLKRVHVRSAANTYYKGLENETTFTPSPAHGQGLSAMFDQVVDRERNPESAANLRLKRSGQFISHREDGKTDPFKFASKLRDRLKSDGDQAEF